MVKGWQSWVVRIPFYRYIIPSPTHILNKAGKGNRIFLFLIMGLVTRIVYSHILLPDHLRDRERQRGH